MMDKAKLTGTVLALGAAMVFAVAPVAANAKHNGKSMVHCAGVNACKGKSSCKGADNSCKGENACKGKGWVEMKAGTCDQVGGTVEK